MRGRALLVLVVLDGCAPRADSNGEASTTDGSATSTVGSEGASQTSTSQGASQTSTSESTSTSTSAASTSSSHDGSTATDESTSDAGDSCAPDMECDTWGQDCAQGQKCVLASTDGICWNRTVCLSEVDPALGLDEPCERDPVWNADDSVDRCALGFQCWGDGASDLTGICRPFCPVNLMNPDCDGDCVQCTTWDLNAQTVVCVPAGETCLE